MSIFHKWIVPVGAITLSALALVAMLSSFLSSRASLALQPERPALLPANATDGWRRAYFSLPRTSADRQSGLWESALNADYLFNKTVMLKKDYDATQSCSGSVKTLWVHAGASVVYCYRFRNIGSTTFITMTLVDDQMGTLGPLVLSPPFVPNAAGGFLAYGVPIEAAVTNHATITLEDNQGNTVVRSDTATVKLFNVVWLPIVFGH